MKKLSRRAIIYPIIIVAIAFFMHKNEQLLQESENQSQAKQVTSVPLDASKPAELIPATAPAFPELIFFHENNLQDESIVSKLRDKYYKSCNVQAVDLTRNAAQKQKYADQKTPFAVFALPDGTQITLQAISSYDFFDHMLDSMLKSYAARCQAPLPAASPAVKKEAKP